MKTPEGISFEIPIASPFSRCLALAIDYAIVVALTILMSQVLTALQTLFVGVPLLGDIIADFGTGASIILQFLIFNFYGIFTEWLWSGQTVGKRLFHLRVIDERGLSLSLRQVIIRNIFRILDILPSTFYLIGSISCLVTRRCQRIGDIAAGTLVIRESKARAPHYRELLNDGENSFASLPHLEARLRQRTTPEEARIALDAVTRRNELTPENRLAIFSQLANYFRDISEFPDEITIGLSDEQYVRNVVDTLFRRASI
ncbi:MAG: RDD family protein [Verrucomicrobiota bacterium]